jgi:hypothetical protein
MRLRAAFIAFAIFGVQASSVRAVVTQLTPAGFLVTLDARIAGSPDRVYRALVGQVVAPAVDGVLLEQLRRLKRFVERGNPRDE